MTNVCEQVFLHSMDGVLVVHPSRDVVLANPAACAMLGRSEAELQRTPRDLLFVDTAELHDRLAERNAGTPVRGEVQMLHADGSTFLAEFTSGLMSDGVDQLAYVIFRDVSDRQAMQVALRASESRHRSFFENVMEGICYISPVKDAMGQVQTWYVVEANLAMQRILHRSDLQGVTLHEIFGAQADARMPVYEKVRATGEPQQIETEFFGRTVLNRLTRHSENVVCVFSLDVTEQRRAERELRAMVAQATAQAAELRAVLDAAPTAIWVTRDASGEQIETNRYAADLQRLPRGTVIQLGNPEFERLHHYVPSRGGIPIPPEDVPVRVAARTGKPVIDSELELVFDDGSVRHLIGNAVPLHTPDGRPSGAVGAFIDITDRKVSEQALAAALGRFDAFMTAMPTLAWAKDPEGRLLYVNAAWQRVTGLSCEDAMGRTVPEILPVADPSQAEREDGYVLATGHPLVSLTQMRDAATGALRWWQTVRFIITGPDGYRHLGGIGADITDQKELEQNLRESEARAREAQLALGEATEQTRRTEANFRQAQKMDAVGQLAGGVAHDFNNLLTVILGHCELLAEALHDHPWHSSIEEIQHAGNRAAALTRQLLAFSRRQPLEPRVLNLNTLIRSMEQMFSRLLGEQYDLVVELLPELHTCFVDAGQVEQVVLNLVLNARDAMQDGGRITIETRNVTLDADFVNEHPSSSIGPHVLLSISDVGCGMSAETQAHIFEPFFTTKAAGKGTGLGLSTVYGIVKQSGGNIWVSSTIDHGTTMNVYFPRATGSEAKVPATAAAPVDYTGSETILLSEDDAPVRATVAGMLRRAGYRVLEASNGSDALDLYRQHEGTIALVITDVVMPKMHGRELADRLQNVWPAPRVLFISGYNDNMVVHEGVVDADIDFLQKPLTADVLLPKVREILNRPIAIDRTGLAL